MSISYISRGGEIKGYIWTNPGYKIEIRKLHGVEEVWMEHLLEDDEEIPIYELQGTLNAHIINENNLIWYAGIMYRLEKDTSFDRGIYENGKSKPLYYSEIEIVPW